MSGFFIFPKNNSVCLRPDSSAVGRFFVVTGEIRPIRFQKNRIEGFQMKRIYFKDGEGKTVYVEVSDKVAETYMEVKREAWRNDSYEEYHTTSLDAIQESGHEFADAGADIEAAMISCEDAVEREQMLVKLKSAIPKLTPLQHRTLKKIFVLNMSQAEIAREEGVSEQAISDRVSRIYNQLRKVLKKN